MQNMTKQMCITSFRIHISRLVVSNSVIIWLAEVLDFVSESCKSFSTSDDTALCQDGFVTLGPLHCV